MTTVCAIACVNRSGTSLIVPRGKEVVSLCTWEVLVFAVHPVLRMLRIGAVGPIAWQPFVRATSMWQTPWLRHCQTHQLQPLTWLVLPTAVICSLMLVVESPDRSSLLCGHRPPHPQPCVPGRVAVLCRSVGGGSFQRGFCAAAPLSHRAGTDAFTIWANGKFAIFHS